MSTKFLIIEDQQDPFFQIKRSLKNRFSNPIIYPSTSDIWDQDTSDDKNKLLVEFHYLRERFIEVVANNNDVEINKLFEEILSKYEDIDFYIIDNVLAGHEDRLGKKFYEYLISKNINENKIFFMSGLSEDEMGNINRSHYINKGMYNFSDELANLIPKK